MSSKIPFICLRLMVVLFAINLSEGSFPCITLLLADLKLIKKIHVHFSCKNKSQNFVNKLQNFDRQEEPLRFPMNYTSA